ncbi:MAG TPA: ABC transporter ATP-binding protein [Aliidongia sp.]|uniref:ABC transporter ATP-binding protein n=1 Tax=Aliidongia sp. TaxID=1914230 RepID=UPI002DDD5A90|nr:ABC transporter ATP-binding protein [Aliidongia sp.]HEV2675238.1 ABC transporter ATP-binding protein [Aliidongia sp.]
MSLLRVEALRKSHGDHTVLKGVDLTVEPGLVVALLGASGCGKTTLLRLIAGFETADSGRITLGDRVLHGPGIHVPAERRRIGYVPQEGTLFPHLSVAANVAFGLTRAERRAGRADEAMRLTGLAGLEHRYPHQISGGQQQRTALARALAPAPGLILLDEPFNALELGLRRSVCADVVALLRTSAATAILVTHDPEEAFASADLVAVMRQGSIVQCAAPTVLYRHPIDVEVARLTGQAILLDGTARDGTATTMLGTVALQPGAPSGPIRVMLRPEQVTLGPADHGVAVRPLSSVFRGDHALVTVAIGDTTLDLRLNPFDDYADTLALRVNGACMAFALT